MREPRIAFFLGSGISIAVGLPGINDITEKILSGSGFMRDNSHHDRMGRGKYICSNAKKDECFQTVLTFLQLQRKESDCYYQRHPPSRSLHSTNYEDLYYMAKQIEDSEKGEYDNPAMQPLADNISPRVQPHLHRLNYQLVDVAAEAANYIRDAVRLLLEKECKELIFDRLRLIRDICQDNEITAVDIFTLNHDTVLECYLHQSGVKAVDGFGKLDSKAEMRYWNPGLFEHKSRVRVFKLHGSINWFPVQAGDERWTRRTVGIPLQLDFLRGESTSKRLPLNQLDDRPLILAGTFNKMLEYTQGIFTDLFCQFHRGLYQTQRLVVIGYGFGDKAINSQIIEWMNSSPANRILVIDCKSEKKFRDSTRRSIWKNWDNWKRQKKLDFVSKGIAEISWPKIKQRRFFKQ